LPPKALSRRSRRRPQTAPGSAASRRFRRPAGPLTCSRPGKTPKAGHRLGIGKTLLTCRAPLRNRTVDLLLTMDRCTVPLPLVEQLTRQNTSTDQHPQAPDMLSRARFATQSATHFDLDPAPPLRGSLRSSAHTIDTPANDRHHRPRPGQRNERRQGSWLPAPTPSAARHAASRRTVMPMCAHAAKVHASTL
jgi:hypothetical protein